MKRSAVSITAGAVVVYGALCAGLYAGQRSLLYFPTPESQSTHAIALFAETRGATLKVWHVARGSDHAILYFGGNSEDVASNIEPLATLFPSADIYLVNYRGYGGSSGSPSEAALLDDAEIVFDLLRDDHARISVVGRSLGSGVAVHIASLRDVHKLVLVTRYDSVLSVAKARFAVIPVSLLLKDKFDSFSKAANIDVSTMIFLAERDYVIPHRHSERLVTAFPSEHVRLRTIPGTTHDSIVDAEEYRRALRDFLRI
jgi:hypothetical protein